MPETADSFLQNNKNHEPLGNIQHPNYREDQENIFSSDGENVSANYPSALPMYGLLTDITDLSNVC